MIDCLSIGCPFAINSFTIAIFLSLIVNPAMRSDLLTSSEDTSLLAIGLITNCVSLLSLT